MKKRSVLLFLAVLLCFLLALEHLEQGADAQGKQQLENALRRTRDCRPDLLEKWLAEDRKLKKDEKKILDKILSGE